MTPSRAGGAPSPSARTTSARVTARRSSWSTRTAWPKPPPNGGSSSAGARNTGTPSRRTGPGACCKALRPGCQAGDVPRSTRTTCPRPTTCDLAERIPRQADPRAALQERRRFCGKRRDEVAGLAAMSVETATWPGRSPRRTVRSGTRRARHCSVRQASVAAVLVVAVDPGLPRLALVSAFWHPVEDPVVAPQELNPPTRGRVRLVDGLGVQDEDAEAEALRQVTGHVGAVLAGIATGDGRQLLEHRRDPFARLLRTAGETHIGVEVAVVAGGPVEAPAHPLAIREQPLDRRT